MRNILLAVVVMAVALAGCNDDGDEATTEGSSTTVDRWVAGAPCETYPAFPNDTPQPRVTIETNMGTVVAEIYADAVPVTAANFLAHVEAGHYDGTPFHRIMDGFMMQGGDLTRRDPALPAADTIPDEFHHRLRHAGPGILSMANAGPNTGSSQFFITFGDTAWLNDKHSVFGRVVEGLDVIERVNAEAASEGGTPEVPVTLEKATVAPAAETTPTGPLALWTPDQGHLLPLRGGKTTYILVAENCGEALAPSTFTADAPEGVSVSFEKKNLDLPAGQRVVNLVTLDVKGNAPAAEVPITVAAGDISATLNLQFARSPNVTGAAKDGDGVTGNYIGLLTDGRFFDTSVEDVALFADENGLGFSTFQVRPSYAPFDFDIGGRVIEGFSVLATGLPEGGQGAARIPPEQAYGNSGQSPLAGRTLVFELEILELS